MSLTLTSDAKVSVIRMLKRLCCTLLLAAMLGAGSIAHSQSQSDRKSISGTVLDQNNAAIVGARVDLLRNGVKVQSVATDEAGTFGFNRVSGGGYQLHVSADGFETSDETVTVGLQPVAPLRIVMAVASLRQMTTVTSDPSTVSTETSDNQNAAVVSGDTLGNLPVFDQDYVAAMSRFLDPGAIGSGGVTLVVNGLESNGVPVSASAIKEIKINQDPYSAEFSRPGRGRIEITTKPGTPEYHGTFNFIFRDAHFNARDPLAVERPPEQRRIYEGVLTGPIRHSKKTTFLISVNRNEEDLQAVVFAQGLNGPIRENVATPSRNFLIAGEVHHAIRDNNTYSLRYSFQNRTVDNQGVGGITLPEAGANNQFLEHEITWLQDTVLSPKLVNQFRLLLGHYSQPTISVKSAPKIVVQDAFIGGGAQADQLRTEYHFALTETLSYLSGKHSVKVGFNVPDWSRRGFDNNLNTRGTFFFSSLADYAQSKPYAFTQQQGDGRLVFLEKVLGGFGLDQYRLKPNLTVTLGLRYDWQNYFHDSNNFAPRLGFAFSPDKKQRTVIRGGAGVFYDRTGPRPIQDVLLYDGSRLRLYVLTDPGFPDPLSGGRPLAAQPISVTRLEPNIHIPYLFQFSIGIERQLQKTTSISFTYVGTRGVGVFRSRDTNAPPPPLYLARPDSSFGLVREIESAGHSQADSLEVALRGKVTRYFTGMAQYRYSRAYDNTSGINYFPPNAYDLSGEWARSDNDRRHRFDLMGTINPGKLLNLGVITSLYSGAPYTLTTGRDDFNTGTANARPAGFARNSLEGPGYVEIDLRWSRDFFLAKKKGDKGPTVTVALDAFNAPNRVNYVGFVGNLSSPFFGQAVAAQPPRRLQLTARFKF